MQRSRKALLHRRALNEIFGRNHLFTVSLSLLLVMWGLVFLLNIWISRGDGCEGQSLSTESFLCNNCITAN